MYLLASGSIDDKTGELAIGRSVLNEDLLVSSRQVSICTTAVK